MINYLRAFNNLVKEAPDLGDLENSKFAIPVNPNIECNTDLALQKIRRSLKEIYASPFQLVGRCYEAVRFASFALCEIKVKHTITIGNVLVNDKPYFTTTKQSIENEKKEGFIPYEPANAHAWLTLEDGTILDCTIIPSTARWNKEREPKWIKAIYCSKVPYKKKLEHIPLNVGIDYLAKVVNLPSYINAIQIAEWACKIDDLLNEQ